MAFRPKHGRGIKAAHWRSCCETQQRRRASEASQCDEADTDPLNFENVAAQRNLNDKGKTLAKAFGDALRQVGIPVGKVYTSSTTELMRPQ